MFFFSSQAFFFLVFFLLRHFTYISQGLGRFDLCSVARHKGYRELYVPLLKRVNLESTKQAIVSAALKKGLRLCSFIVLAADVLLNHKDTGHLHKKFCVLGGFFFHTGETHFCTKDSKQSDPVCSSSSRNAYCMPQKLDWLDF